MTCLLREEFKTFNIALKVWNRKVSRDSDFKIKNSSLGSLGRVLGDLFSSI